MDTQIDNLSTDPPAAQPNQESKVQEINRASRISRPQRPRTHSRTDSLLPHSRMHKELHLPAFTNMEEVPANNPSSDPLCLTIQTTRGVVYRVTPNAVNAAYRKLNEPIITWIDRISAELPLNDVAFEDLDTTIEQLESVSRSRQLEMEPAISAVSALRVEFNRFVETIFTRLTKRYEK